MKRSEKIGVVLLPLLVLAGCAAGAEPPPPVQTTEPPPALTTAEQAFLDQLGTLNVLLASNPEQALITGDTICQDLDEGIDSGPAGRRAAEAFSVPTLNDLTVEQGAQIVSAATETICAE